ncbi:hypothetical protein EVAR_79836_1 [Eumeta japonica]|uniref:Reverse transcriptase domain-containing protein n=1 Tax=Eumeta variegata TaxID=151549 RepID=A0A4C1TZ00_EUMVA|nr:hypothetical protein EVAR_79836_1 [Eumeta japonica]
MYSFTVAILYNPFMDDCLYNLKENECELRMDELSVKRFSYTDDQVILAPLARELQTKVTITNDSIKETSMEINVSKSKVMVFERSKDTNELDMRTESNLGNIYIDDGKHDRDIERRANAGNIRFE